MSSYRKYVLENGLTLFLAVYRDEPRIHTRIAVRGGAAHDPPGASGTAHLAEHLFFKGTRTLGSLDSETEEKGLKELAELYAREPENREALYQRADRMSCLADPQGWDRAAGALGAGDGNAFTGYEGTIFSASVPKSSLRDWLALERLRFEEACLRFFSSEVEIVLDELRRDWDDDGARLYGAVCDYLSGAAPILGRLREVEALTPGEVAAWMRRYYRPERTVLVLSGDLDPPEVLSQVEETWGDWLGLKGWPRGVQNDGEGRKASLVSGSRHPQRAWSRWTRHLAGPDSEQVQLVWSIELTGDGLTERERALGIMAERLLHNDQAGLIDQRLVKKQMIQAGEAALELQPGGAGLLLAGYPRKGQSLDTTARLLRGGLEDLASGNWDARLLRAVVQDLRISRTEAREAHSLDDTCAFVFLENRQWEDWLSFISWLESLTKEDICRFAAGLAAREPLVLYKRKGVPPELVPRQWHPYQPLGGGMCRPLFGAGRGQPRRLPWFPRYEDVIMQRALPSGGNLYGLWNRENRLFDFQIIFPRGIRHSPLTLLAAEYLNYRGTQWLLSEELGAEFFYQGLDWGVTLEDEYTYLGFSGPRKHLAGGIDLMRGLTRKTEATPGLFRDFIEGERQEREEGRRNRRFILEQAMEYRAVYREKSPLDAVTSLGLLDTVGEEELLDEIGRLWQSPYEIFYYGPEEAGGFDGIGGFLEGSFLDGGEDGRTVHLKEPVPAFPIDRPSTGRVYFYPYDQGQTDVLMVSPGPLLDRGLFCFAAVFNQLFGAGGSSLVFREFREVRALGYAGAGEFSCPERPEDPHLLRARMSTPPARMAEGIQVMLDLFNRTWVARQDFLEARDAVLSRLEHERVLRDNVFWHWYTDQRQGWMGNSRREIYEGVRAMDWDSWEAFLDRYIRRRNFSYLLMGRRAEMDWQGLEHLGPIREWTEEELFHD